jgi:CRISPR-associated endoribonuclease Cas6
MALQPSQAFRFDLSLFGRGCRYVPYCVLALQRVGSVGFGKGKGRFVLTAVLQRQGTRWHSIFDPRTGLLSARKPQEGLPMGSPLPSDRWEIRTLTPLHLQKDGSPVKHPEFGDFVLAICRRLNHLSAAHQEGRVQVDPRPFMERCRGIRWKETEYRWVVTQRYSARQDRHMPLEGVLATYCAEGDLEPFADLFRLGEVMNIGKHTAFGFGQIAVAPGGIE